jgi:parallel beta-helix repeat protein
MRPLYRYPPELWTAPLTGAELIPIDAGSVYPTSITLGALAAWCENEANVLLFGADPTGVCDSTASFQAAVDSLTAGGTVRVPVGAYSVAGVNLNGTSGLLSNIRIIGEGWGSALKLPAGTQANVLQATAGGGFAVENLTIDGNKANNTPSGDYTRQNGVALWNVSGGGVRNCLVRNTVYTGILPGAPTLAQAGSSNLVISGNYVTGCVTGIAAMRQNNNDITANLVISASTYGIVSDQQSSQVDIVGNTVSGCGNLGIYLYNNTGTNVDGNISNYNLCGVVLDNGSTQCGVTGNTCSHNSNSGIKSVSLSLLNDITGNICISNGQFGIEVNDSTQTAVTANTCCYNTYAGIGLTNGGENHSVTGNTCNNNLNSGIIASATTQALIEGNYCLDNNQAADASDGGIRLASSSSITVDGNQCYDDQVVKTQNWGVVSDGTASGNRIINNNLTPNKTAAAAFVGANTVRQNTGWITEAQGSTAITAGNTSVVVTHGLSVTPEVGAIQVTRASAPGSDTAYWVDTVGTTTFTLHVNANPGGTVYFYWQATNL